jgi:hypothetical protein
MTHSVTFYSWLNIACLADTADDQKRILAEAKEELTAEEYEALVRALGDAGFLK